MHFLDLHKVDVKSLTRMPEVRAERSDGVLAFNNIGRIGVRDHSGDWKNKNDIISMDATSQYSNYSIQLHACSMRYCVARVRTEERPSRDM